MPESSAETPMVVSESTVPRFGELLRRLRTESGLSQDGLAERAGISGKTIGALEQGVRRAAHDDTVNRIAEALRLPSTEHEALLRSARHARARRPEETAGAPERNLPAPLTSFIERPEVDAIGDLLERNRLVTIIGTGGVGKTRTAIEVAHRTIEPNQRLWFIDLSKLHESSTILSELNSVLGIALPESEDAFAAAVRCLNAGPSYLIIDNCEHLLDDLAELVPRLLRACPQLRILATSREPMSLSFEASYRLPSLDVPLMQIRGAEEALGYSAVRLFLARSDARASWLLKPSSIAKIVELCQRLDGIPLAIELASSRVATLGLDMLLKDLTRGLRLPGKRDYPERHQTMTATIAWSYDLLDRTEQAVLRRLSIFAGTFSLDVAQRVCAADDLPAFAIVDACHRLAQKSLIVVEHGDPIRYRLLGAIRSFGEDRMSSSESETMHANYIGWLRELSDRVHQNPPGLALSLLEPDFDNVRAGVERCLERGREEDILDAAAIAGGLRLLWYYTSRTRELKRYVDQLLDRLDPEKHAHWVSRLLLAAMLYASLHEVPALIRRTIPLLIADENFKAAAAMLEKLANFQMKSGDTEGANQSLRDAFEFVKDIDPAINRAYWRCLLERAWVFCAQGNVVAASADLQELASYLNDSNDPDGDERWRLQIVAAEVAYVRGETVAAIDLLSRLIKRSGIRPETYEFEALVNLGLYHATLGNCERALQHVRAILAKFVKSDRDKMFDGFYLVLITAALVAVDYGEAGLGAVIFGHCKEHWLKQRAILATEAPGYERLVSLLGARYPSGELNELLSDGAAVAPNDILRYVLANRLFGLIDDDVR